MSQPIKDYANAIVEAARQTMFGVDDVIRLSLVALYSDGHILLEGNPGLGKTELVKTLGNVLKLDFGRIQFTPDLMPADITGTYMPDITGGDAARLSFRPGPIFTSLLLADEINRATPKTQSAMLEGMAERQVTVLGEKCALDPPFMVLATQNPIDHEGTYNLPEAQADRFMFKVLMPVPNHLVMQLIMQKASGTLSEAVSTPKADQKVNLRLLPKDTADSKQKYTELRRQIEQVVPLPSVEAHILNMFLASNRRFTELEDLDKKQVESLKKMVDNLITYGLGPRAPIALMLGAKAWGLMFSPGDYADGPALANVVIPVLRHRLKLEFDWDDRYRQMSRKKTENSDSTGLLEKLLLDFCLLTAPNRQEYRRVFEHTLQQILSVQVR